MHIVHTWILFFLVFHSMLDVHIEIPVNSNHTLQGLLRRLYSQTRFYLYLELELKIFDLN